MFLNYSRILCSAGDQTYLKNEEINAFNPLLIFGKGMHAIGIIRRQRYLHIASL